jgi:hypothetical protein
MLIFPTLKTGSAVQYPSSTTESFSTDVLQFLAGDEQRFLTSAAPLRSWQVELQLLDEAELDAIEAFFVAASGQYETFSFTDPATGTSYPNCFIAQDKLTEVFDGELRTGLTLRIQQGRA